MVEGDVADTSAPLLDGVASHALVSDGATETAKPPALGGPAGGFPSFFQVQLDQFDGPIDLLLHLVKQNELPIEKISLAQVATQYLECIEAMRYFDLDVAGEYLVIAATLVSLKSSVLLNEPVELVDDGLGNLIDPHELLLQRLREAAVYRDGAAALKERSLLGVDVFPSQLGLAGVPIPPTRYRVQDADVLARAFQKVVQKIRAVHPGFTITIEHISIVERMRVLLDRLSSAGGRVSFAQLLLGRRAVLLADTTSPSLEARHHEAGQQVASSLEDEPLTRGSLVGTFVAILELCKRQVLKIEPGDGAEQIFISIAMLPAKGEGAPVLDDNGLPLDPELLRSEFDDSEVASEGNDDLGSAAEVANR
jgi:segregation and condensation protein A